MLSKEEWKPIKNYENIYEVSNLGNIKSLYYNKQKILKPGKRNGYPHIILRKGNKSKTEYVHNLVLTTFVGLRPKNYECCHNDGNRENCNLNNLRWDSRKNNQKDKLKHGTDNRGEKSGNSKLTNEQVIKIKQLFKTNLLDKEIAKMYNVHRTTINRIRNKIDWRYINGK